MSAARIALVCPGRGSYSERTLRSLPDEHPWITRAEALRARAGLPSLAALDRAPRFQAAQHLKPSNVAPLIWLITLLDCAAASREGEPVCVLGNSMGWYTALAVAGALSFDDGFRLVQALALLQELGAAGGQVIYPRVGEDWRPDPALHASVEAALRASGGEAFRSINLGGYAVLAGSEAGIAHLLRALPALKLGSTTYPFRLLQHGPYHTPLAAGVAEAARRELADLRFEAPRTTLIDGLGRCHTPWSADVAELRAYTLGAQVVEPYDFTACVRVALREHAPDTLVLPGPGNSLGGVCGQILVAEGWRGVRSKAEFDREQAGPRPPVRSMRR